MPGTQAQMVVVERKEERERPSVVRERSRERWEAGNLKELQVAEGRLGPGAGSGRSPSTREKLG